MILNDTQSSLLESAARRNRQRAQRPPGVMAAKAGGPRKWQDPEKAKLHRKGTYLRHTERYRQKHRDYYLKNKERLKALRVENYKMNPERQKESGRKYKSKPEAKEIVNAWARNRYRNDPQIKIRTALRARLRSMIGKLKNRRPTESMIGCTFSEFKRHIENLFQRGMKWSNYGKWHFDHIIPCAKFDLSKPLEIRRCFYYQNYQPLWASHNMSKGDSILKPSQIPLGI